MLHYRTLPILLFVLFENMQGAVLPTFDDQLLPTAARIIPIYNFSFYPTTRKVIPTQTLDSVPSSSTDPVVCAPQVPMREISTGLALLYIYSHNVNHERMALKIINRCNQQTVGAMAEHMAAMLRTRKKPITIALLMPSYLVQGKCYYVEGKRKCTIQRLSTREIVTFGKGVYKRKIAYQKWLALSSQIGSDGSGAYVGPADMISTSVQLTDIIMTLPNARIHYKVPSGRDPESYTIKAASAALIASTIEPEKTADLLRTQLSLYHEKTHVYQFFLYDLAKLVLDNSFLDSVLLKLCAEHDTCQSPVDTFRAFREDGYVKGQSSCYPDKNVKYPLLFRDPCIEAERMARIKKTHEISVDKN